MPTHASETQETPQVLRGTEVPIASLLGRRVALLGYGNQGRAHALNLRDSGVCVNIGCRAGSPSGANAQADGFEVAGLSKAVRGAELVIVALPDDCHAKVWQDHLASEIQPGQTIGFLHGLSVHFGLVAPPARVGCVMVAPKGPGTTLREQFVRGAGIPALLAVHQDPGGARELALGWAAGLGCARAGVVLTTFKDEAETDLFGEQAVLCGGMLGLAQAAYETLVEAGYPPLLAYIECVHEIKQVADLLYARGPAGMRAAISNTAEYGALAAAPRVADQHVRDQLRQILRDVQSGKFARTMAEDASAGGPWLAARRNEADSHPMEAAGRAVRALMPWLGSPNADRDPT